MNILETLIKNSIPNWPSINANAFKITTHDVVLSVKQSLGLAPMHIKISIKILMCIFAIFYYTVKNISFSNNNAPMSFLMKLGKISTIMFSLERLIRSLTLLSFMEHPIIYKALSLTEAGRHQAIYRKKRELLGSRDKHDNHSK